MFMMRREYDLLTPCVSQGWSCSPWRAHRRSRRSQATKLRSALEAEHSSRLAQFRESTWTSQAVMVQLLKPDVALVHVDWILKGDKDPDGTPRQPRGGIFTWVVVKQSGEWLIRAAQNTNLGPNQQLTPKHDSPGAR
jgi:hypothetical protein